MFVVHFTLKRNNRGKKCERKGNRWIEWTLLVFWKNFISKFSVKLLENHHESLFDATNWIFSENLTKPIFFVKIKSPQNITDPHNILKLSRGNYKSLWKMCVGVYVSGRQTTTFALRFGENCQDSFRLMLHLSGQGL